MGKNNLEQISNHTFVAKEAGLVIAFASDNRSEIGKVQPIRGSSEKREIKFWGSDNLGPNIREHILMDNNIVGSIMTTKRDILIGQGIQPYIEEISGDGHKAKRIKIPIEMPDKPGEWKERAKFDEKFLIPATDEMLKHENIFPGLMPYNGRGSKKGIANVEAYSCKNIRAVKKNKKGRIPGYLFHGDWADLKNKEHSFSYIPAYTPGAKNLTVAHFGDRFFNDGYYNFPTWAGGIEWVELANWIPKFQKANISNGYTIRFLIKIPKGYFLDPRKASLARTDSQIKKCISEERKKREKFISDVNEVLAGARNAGKAIFTSTQLDPITKKYEGITIEEIKPDLQDEAFNKLFTLSNQAVISGQSLHPTLANIESQGKLSSGSEMLNAFNFYVKVKTNSHRRQLLRTWELVLAANGWDKLTHNGKRIKWGFEDLTMAKLHEDKSGMMKPTVASEN